MTTEYLIAWNPHSERTKGRVTPWEVFRDGVSLFRTHSIERALNLYPNAKVDRKTFVLYLASLAAIIQTHGA